MKTAVIVAVNDMLFASKIRATAEHLNIEVLFAKTSAAVINAAREIKPSLIIFDLHEKKCEPFATAARIKADEQLRGTKLLGFYSHVDTELRRKAEAAGFDSVLPRSRFTKHLAEILQGSDQQLDGEKSDEEPKHI